MSVYRGKVTAVSPGRLIDVLLDDYGKPTIGTLVELVELPADDVTSERDYLRERLRELVGELLGAAAREDAQPFRAGNVHAVRAAAYRGCADNVERIVTEAETGRNRTATPEVQHGHNGAILP